MVLSKECSFGAEHLQIYMPLHFMQACSVNEQFFCLRVLVLALSTLFVKESLYTPTSHSYRQHRPRLDEGIHGM